jgi:predicted adenylyl cyclase CyaB
MEVEMKARIDDIEAMKQKLETKGVKFEGEAQQVDAYYKPENFNERPQGPGDWILRVRTSGDEKTLTIKVLTEITGAWIEHETGINNEEQARKIAETMGLINVFTFHKRRLFGQMGEFEVLLDDVKELGKYIEVALESEEKENTRKKIIDFMKTIGIEEKDVEKRGYGEIMGEKLGHKFHKMK